MDRNTQNRKKPRLDKLAPGTDVLIDGQPAEFVCVEGSGDDREALFRSYYPGGGDYVWAAYRYKGRWVLGSSAQTFAFEVAS
jgi:hypothetical protein